MSSYLKVEKDKENRYQVKCNYEEWEVLETLNELIREDYLYDFILNFQAEWNKILREDSAKENQIRNSSAYMKSCLWDWLKRWKIEEYNLLASLE